MVLSTVTYKTCRELKAQRYNASSEPAKIHNSSERQVIKPYNGVWSYTLPGEKGLEGFRYNNNIRLFGGSGRWSQNTKATEPCLDVWVGPAKYHEGEELVI